MLNGVAFGRETH